MSRIQTSLLVEAPASQVFQLLTDPAALPELLAPVIEVELQSGLQELSRGSEVTYLMSRFGFCQQVRLRVEELVVGRRMTYRQTLGLFKEWIHTVRCEEVTEGQTLVTDSVEYQLPLGVLGLLLSDVWVRRDMEGVLRHRLLRARDRLSQL